MDHQKLRKKIVNDLKKQLKKNGTTGNYYSDLVDDYMRLWDTKNLLIEDIEKRGAVVDYVSNNGTANKRKNDSVGELVKVNDRMIKLLEALGITPERDVIDDDDEM